jgi:hypothetical protein
LLAAVCVTRDGSSILSCGLDSCLKVTDAHSFETLYTQQAPSPLTALALDPRDSSYAMGHATGWMIRRRGDADIMEGIKRAAM